MKNRFLELVFGLVVIFSSIVFVVYLTYVVVNGGLKTYTLKGQFFNIGSLTEGSKVTINGFTVGKVSKIELSYPNYSIIVSMEINRDIKITKDSELTIKSSGLFDAPEIAIIPTKGEEYIATGDTFKKSKDWVSLEDKIGNMFFNLDE